MNREILHVTEEQVKQTLTVKKSLELAREAYVCLQTKQVVNPERAWLTTMDETSLYCMPCYVIGRRTMSVKVARQKPHNPERSLPSVMAMIHVYDSGTGIELARIEAESLTALRTAASSAVATDLLAGKDAEVLGIFGTGRQAEAHIPAIQQVRRLTQAVVYSRNETSRKEFAKRASNSYRMPVTAAQSPEEVLKSADIVVLATNSTTPLFNGDLVPSGAHVNAVGAALPTSREVDSRLVQRSLVIVDSKPQALSSYGDIMIPAREGALESGEIVELGELLADHSKNVKVPGRTTLFKSGGVAVLDAVCADHLLTHFMSNRQ